MAKETQRMTIEIPKSVHEKLTKLAEADRRSRVAEIIVALEERFDAFVKAGKIEG